jgi:methionyl-tRNA formyltransferase
LDKYFSGNIKMVRQNDEEVSKTRLIKKADGLLDLNKSANILERAVRAYNPWPGAYFFWRTHQIKVIKAKVLESSEARPNQHVIFANKPAIGTANGYLVMDSLQPAGKKPMSGEEFLRGVKNWLD